MSTAPPSTTIFDDILGGENTNLVVALDLASRGFVVFPMRDWNDGDSPKGIRNFPELATCDAGQIEQWWRTWPDAWPGLLTGERNGITVLDVDRKNGKDGLVTLQAAGLAIEDFPVRTRTPSGGWHLFAAHEPRIKNWAGKLGTGLDTRNDRGLVIAPGAIRADGGQYVPEGTPLGSVALPAFPASLIPPPEPERIAPAPVVEPTADQIAWAAERLVALASGLATTPEGQRESTLNAAVFWAGGAAAHGFVSEEQARAALGPAAVTCGLGRREFAAKFRRGGAWQKGLARPLTEFPGQPIDAQAVFDEETGDPVDLIGTDAAADLGTATDSTPGWVADLNRRHAVAFVQGRTVILTEQDDGAVAYGSPTDLHNFYENKRVRTDRGGSRAITRAWMEHRGRRSYPNGIVFAPAGGPAGAYNHWRGWAVEPDPAASCPLFLAHLRDVICSGNETAAEWTLKWFAHMIQRPGEKPGTALVLRGRKGAGKDTVGEYLGTLFPRHHTKIAHAEHLHGRFNAHQERTLLLHVEEGFWAGDHKAEASLKSLITSEQVQIERKGIDAFQVPSVLRVFISSNSDWVVPASTDERRFCVLDVSPHRAGDVSYFAALRKEMEGGGRAGLLHHLQSLDLNGFNVRQPPMTEGLREQKLQSLRNVERWWFEVLQAGELPATHAELDADGVTWNGPLSASRDGLRGHYREWLKDRRFDGAAVDQRQFGRRLRELCPGVADRRIGGRSARAYAYALPPLAECRRSFEGVIGLCVDWDALDSD